VDDEKGRDLWCGRLGVLVAQGPSRDDGQVDGWLDVRLVPADDFVVDDKLLLDGLYCSSEHAENRTLSTLTQ
jgi:hypothetical protein